MKIISALGYILCLPAEYDNSTVAIQREQGSGSGVYLTRTAAKLYTNCGTLEDHHGRVLISRLLCALRFQGSCGEASDLGEVMTEKLAVALGEGHRVTLHYMTELGASYRNQDRFQESVMVLQKVVKFQKPDVSPLDAGWLNTELGKSLRGLKRYQDATIYIGKAFRAYMKEYGATGEHSFFPRIASID
jgi:hypothetical protein